MGIDISAKLLYGTPYSDLPEEILDEVNDMLDMGDLDYASPYYDAPRDEWIVGVEINAEIPEISAQIPEILVSDDIDLGFYVTPRVY